jgi:creatinine amidohydrolase/Fe(II)-dependent formamide hydrolase-like protein
MQGYDGGPFARKLSTLMLRSWSRFSLFCALLLCCALGTLTAIASTPSSALSSVFLEDWTSPELRERIATGTTTVLIPIGGTEQNGPHMVLGKHNVRVRLLSEQIARALGKTVVAPVVAYVPEGTAHPPVAHMRFSGTLTIPDTVFEALIESTARSLKQHGLRDIVLLGDHGGYQKNLVRVANKLNREWARDPTARVHALTEYYQATQTDFVQTLKARGYSAAEIGTHAGLADTSLAMAVDPMLVRADRLTDAKGFSAADGTYGDPRRSNVEAGRVGVQQIIDASVKAIRHALQKRANE